MKKVKIKVLLNYLKNQNEQNHNINKNMKYYRVVKITRPKLHL